MAVLKLINPGERMENEQGKGDPMAGYLEEILKQQIEIVGTLGGITEGVAGIKEHLRMLNGTTARTVDRVTTLESTVKAHPGFCEVRALVAEQGKDLAILKTESAGRDAVNKERSDVEAKNERDAQPYKWLFFLLLVAMILSNGKNLIGLLGVK